MFVLAAITLLTTIDSSNTRCHGWRIVADNGTVTSIWWIVAIAAGWSLVTFYYVVTWRQFAQRIVDKIEWGEPDLGN